MCLYKHRNLYIGYGDYVRFEKFGENSEKQTSSHESTALLFLFEKTNLDQILQPPRTPCKSCTQF